METEIDLYVKTIKAINEVYEEYLKDEGCDDTPILRAGYFMIAKDEIEKSELPTPVKDRVIGRIEVKIRLAMKEAHDILRNSFKRI